ncbi:MAG: hypothetical protein CR960_00095 [Pasteurellales bacterium]|nr:MAG: hypothetical protein CR960_00095 [Pasteurellales bacterium]
MIWYKVLFSLQGRINRKAFWTGIGFNFLFLFLLGFFIDTQNLTIITVVPLFISIFSIGAVSVKRLHDRNRSGFNVFMLLFPVLCYVSSFGLEGKLAWGLGVVFPVFIITVLVMDLGVFQSSDENKYGKKSQSIIFK